MNAKPIGDMNKGHPNIDIIMKFNPANIAAVAEVLAEDFVWHFINAKLPELQGDYFGIEGLTDFFKKMAGPTKNTFKVHPVSITPMGDELVVVHVKDRMVLTGKPMEIDALVVWRVVDGKIKEAWDIPAVYTAKVMEQ